MIPLRAHSLLRRHCDELSPRLYRLAWSWCRDSDTAQDLVQETWTRAFERAGQLKDEKRLLAWLSRIMINLYRDRLRARREVVDIDNIEFAGEEHPETLLDRQDDIERVRGAVAALPLNYRMVLTLVDLMDFSYAQVSELLDIPMGTVMSRLARSRRILKESLGAPAAPAARSELRRVK